MTLSDWRRSRIILIGQAPGPTGPPPGRPLVGGRSGTFMQSLTGCQTLKDYIKHFETMNVLDWYPGRAPGGKGDRFPMTEARVAARDKLPQLLGRKVVFCGSGVAEAFDAVEPIAPFTWMMRLHAAASFQWAMVPHPSPVNRFWNDPANVARAKQFFDLLLGRATLGSL